MYSQSFNCSPNKKQSSLTGSLPHSFGLLRNFTTKSFAKYGDSSTHLNVDFTTTVKVRNPDHFTSLKTTNMMDFIYNFRDSTRNSSKIPLSKGSTPVSVESKMTQHNCKEIIFQCDTLTTVASSHLVGGFVGSKSQLGRSPAHGVGIKMWDIIRQRVDWVTNSSSEMSSKVHKQAVVDEKCIMSSMLKAEEKQKIVANNTCNKRMPINGDKEEEKEKCYKQSYADVAKSKLPILKENPSVIIVEKSGDIQNSYYSKDCNESMIVEPCSFYNPGKGYHLDRDRITSECSADSEDSFIVFEYCEGDDNIVYGSGSSDDESLLGFCMNQETTVDTSSSPSGTLNCNSSCKQTAKKVHFANEKNLTKVHPMITWDYAYRMARRGPWEMLARDSERFKCRIANIETVLKPVLEPAHRETVYQQRFANLIS